MFVLYVVWAMWIKDSPHNVTGLEDLWWTRLTLQPSPVPIVLRYPEVYSFELIDWTRNERYGLIGAEFTPHNPQHMGPDSACWMPSSSSESQVHHSHLRPVL